MNRRDGVDDVVDIVLAVPPAAPPDAAGPARAGQEAVREEIVRQREILQRYSASPTAARSHRTGTSC